MSKNSPQTVNEHQTDGASASRTLSARNKVAAAFLLFLLAVLPFLPVLRADYLNWDDDFYFTANPAVHIPGGWKEALLRFDEDAHQYPVVLFSFILEHRFFGFDPRVSHGVNLILHGAVAATAFLLLSRWVSDWRIAFWAVLFFSVHPLQTSTVAWVAERKSFLGSIFFLVALGVGVSRKPRWLPWLSLPIAALAYLCKSPLIVFPAVLLAAGFLREDRPRDSAWWMRFGLHSLFALLFALIYAGREVSQLLSPLERAELIPRTLAHYLSKWASPTGLAPVYPQWEFVGWPTVAGGWLAIAVVAFLLFLLRKRIDRIEWWAGVFFLATLSPALGFVSFGYQRHSFVSDHFAYLPLLGLSLLLASAITRVSLGRSFLLPFILAGITVLWGTASWMECAKWRNSEAFWGAVLRADPKSWTAHTNLAAHLEREGRLDEARAHQVQAVETDPEEPIGWINLGRGLILSGEYEKAVRVLARAIDLNVYYVEAHLLRAEAYLRMGEEQRASDQLHSAVAVRPGEPEARLRMADLLLHANAVEVRDPARALRFLRPFENLPPAPESLRAWRLLAEAHSRLGDFESAIRFEKKRLGAAGDPGSSDYREASRRISFYERGVAAPDR